MPSFLKAYYGMNEIITTLMMAFLGINLANLLIKGPFLTDVALRAADQCHPVRRTCCRTSPARASTSASSSRSSCSAWCTTCRRAPRYGLRLRILGANPRAAIHAGINVKRDIMTAFALSGGLIGLAAAVEILGVWGYVRADWNPAFGMTLFAIVFLAGLNVMVVIPFVFFFAVIQIGGHEAAREAGLPNDFLLLLVGLILFFMVLTEWARTQGWFSRRRKEVAAGVALGPEEAVSSG